MNDDLDLGIRFNINSPEAKAAAEEVRKSVRAVNTEATTGAQKTAAAEKQREGVLERLNRRLKELKQSQLEATSTIGIEKANAKIQEFEKEIQRLTRIGKVGFDDMGKAIPDFDRPVGKLNRLIAVQKLYEKAVRESTNPAVITKYNQKLEETATEINKVKNAGKKGFDELGNKLKENTGLLGKFKSGLLSIAGALGLAFGIQTVIQFGKELFKVAKEAEGVELAFSRIKNSQKVLEDLKTATRGQVNELVLMRTAVKASDFKIPMDVLAKGLAFAQQKAADTGKDVDYLVNSFVDGIGRKSIRVIDNLNISQAEVQAEMKKTGDFATAVGNVIDRQMEAAGTQVDALATKTGGMAAKWDNAKTAVAGFFRALLNPELADPKKIAALTDQYSKSYSKFGTYSVDQQKEIIANTEKVVKEQAKAYAKAREKYKNNTGGEYADLALAKEGERLKALQNVLNNLKSQNKELEISERKKKGILSIEELEQELSDLKVKRDSELNRDEIKVLNEKIKAKQDIINALNGTDDKKAAKADNKAERERIAALERQYTLKQKLSELDNEYSRKTLNSNDAEVQAVRDKFAKIADEIKHFNANPKNVYKVDGSALDGLVNKAIADVKYKQDTEKLKASLEQQKQIFADYETYKKTFGEEKAKERFAKELDLAKDTTDKAAKEFAALNTASLFGGLNGKQQERFAVLQKDLQDQSEIKRAKQEADFKVAFEAAKTNAQKLIEIEREYNEQVKALGENATAEQLTILNKRKEQQRQAVNAEAIQSDTNWAEMFGNFGNMSRDAVTKYLDTVRERVNKERALNKISLGEYNQLLGEIDNALQRLDANNSFARVGSALKKYRQEVNKVGADGVSAKQSFNALAGEVSNAAGDVNQIIGQVASSLDKLGIGGEGLQDTLNNVMGIVGGIGDIGKGLATGNPVDIIKGSIQLLTSAIDLFNTKDKKIEKRIAQYQNQLKQLGKDFADLERQVNNSVGESYYKDSEAEIRNLRSQQKLLQQSIDAERGKKKADGGKIDAWQQQLDAIPHQIDDINKAVSEMLIQTTFKDFANQLSDAFSDAFSAGEDAAGRFDDAFDKVIQNAVKNSLKLKLIEPYVKQFTDELTDYAKNNNNSVIGFNFDKYRQLLKEKGEQYTETLASLGDLFKTDDINPDAKDSPLSNAVKGITADQADIVAAQLGGLRVAQIETNNISRAGFASMLQNGIAQLAAIRAQYLTLLEIAANSLRTANNTEKLTGIETSLKSIDKKMDSDAAAIKAGGI